MVATCISCSRKFEASEAYINAVRDGKTECLCPYCDGSHDDDTYEDREYDEE